VLALPMWAVLWNARAILRAIGESPELSANAATYLHGLQWAMAPNLLFFALRSVFAALDRPGPTLFAGLSAVAVNALADWLLVFGHFGFPAWGVFGSGAATFISQCFMMLVLLVYALVDPHLKRYRLFSDWRIDGPAFAALWLTRTRGDFAQILPEADIVVEVMGGLEPAREHLLAAMRAGVDIVTAQIALAFDADAPLPRAVRDLWAFGFAVEAEDRARGALRAAGVVRSFQLPSGPGVRVDPAIGEGQVIVPSRDNRLAFVTVSFGGFGSVLGALVAGLIIGVVESLSAYLIGPVYKDVIVYVLFVLVLWFRPQGLMGKA